MSSTTDSRFAAVARKGFVLPMTLAMILVVTVVIGALMGYVSFAVRTSRVFLAKDRCRFAAQSAIECAKVDIQAGFSAYTGGSTASTIKIDPRQAEAYNWFDNVSADHRTIGLTDAKHEPVRLVDPVGGINGCKVYVGIGRYIDHRSGEPYAAVPVVATAVYTYPDGLEVSVTIQESICFATGQSQVFNYAYFVNNYGWMSGSSITINGDMRANGNVSLSASTVNGFVYAAANSELKVNGSVSLSSSPQIKNVQSYRTSVGNRGRPDIQDFETAGAFDAPRTSGTIKAPSYDRDGNVISGTLADNSGKPIVNSGYDSLPMPFVSELGDYVDYAVEKGGRLVSPAYSYTDSAGVSHKVAQKTINAHYVGAGPSGDESLADNGAVVLVGTQSNPIQINGPVVIDNDVIIKGYVKGQGTIYCGRNVHIIGDVKYLNAPNWNHTDADDTAVETSNATKDMLGLVAKGNIVVGDCSSSSWMSSVGNYIKTGNSSSVVNKYACDPSDANIGYPATFQGDYTAKEYVAGGGEDGSGYFDKVRYVAVQKTREEHYQEKYWTGEYKTVGTGWNKKTEKVYAYRDAVRTVNYTENELANSRDRRYYETVCDNAVMTQLKDSGVGQIDAILYNNHGVFGTPGKSGAVFNLNGSLVCRDEALIFSGNGIRFNWDFRLMPKNNNKVTSALALPVGPQAPYTVTWQEVPSYLNPVYPGGSAN